MSTDRQQPEQDEPLRARREHRGEAIVVHVSGELDQTTAPVLREQLTAAFADAAAGDRIPVVVDLTETDFIASIGMALLVEHHHIGDRHGTPLHVVAPSRHPLRALRAATLDRLLRLHPTLAEALADTSI